MTPTEPDAPKDPSVDASDLGTPITELRGLMLPVDERFAPRLRNRIDRRLLAGTFVDFAWSGPLMVLLELLRAPFEFLSGKRRP